MELGAYPRHRLRLFQANNAGLAAAGVAQAPVRHQSASEFVKVDPSFKDLADQILTGVRRQPKVPMISPVASSSQERASKLDFLLKLGGTISDAMPSTKSCPSGHRLESYENGASVTKDELGRVVEVSSNGNQQVFITYSPSGFLKIFFLLDAFGNVLLVGEHDEQGVVVKDPQGQIQAAGEYMSAGPNGCLTVHQLDGQFWTIDLVLNTFSERRFMVDRKKRAHCLTAIFSDDGFRMMTRFQALPSNAHVDRENSLNWLGSQSRVTLRFYGRDGSLLEFDSDENLASAKPSLVLPATKQALPGPRNNGTAWDAVARYLNF